MDKEVPANGNPTPASPTPGGQQPVVIRPTTPASPPTPAPVQPATSNPAPVAAPAVTPSADAAPASVPPTPTPTASPAPSSAPAQPVQPIPSVSPQVSSSVAQPSASRLSLLKRHKFIAAAAGIILLALIGLQIRHIMTDNTWKKATAYYEAKDYDNAAKTLEGVSLPGDPKRLKVYAQSMLATRQLDKALDGYQKLYDVQHDEAARVTIANIYAEQKKTDQAVDVYKQVITTDPSNTQAYINLCTLYRQQNKEAEALTTVRQGVSKNPDNTTLLELQVTLLSSNRSSADYRAAVDQLRKRNADDPLLQSLGE